MEPDPQQRWDSSISSDRLESFELYSPDDVLMCHTSARRAAWYLERDLAEMIDRNGFKAVRLKFQPNGLGNCDDPFYLERREVSCVVCGSRDRLTRHHCIPLCFRRNFPDEYKSHMCHDILLICEPCHQLYEAQALKLKQQMITEVRPMNVVRDRERVYRAARTIMRHKHVIPFDKVVALLELIEHAVGRPVSEEEITEIASAPTFMNSKEMWGDYVEALDNIEDFILLWREHFVATMKPRYLPKHWSVAGRYRSHERVRDA